MSINRNYVACENALKLTEVNKNRLCKDCSGSLYTTDGSLYTTDSC